MDLFDRSAHPADLTPVDQRFQPLLEAVLADPEAARTNGAGGLVNADDTCLGVALFGARQTHMRIDLSAPSVVSAAQGARTGRHRHLAGQQQASSIKAKASN